LDIIDTVSINRSHLLISPKITKVVEDENKNEKAFQKEEYKIAKYFSQTKLFEPKNTNKELLFLSEEDAILSLCDGKLYSLNINNFKINSKYFSQNNNIINFTYNGKLRQIITLLESSLIAIFDFDTEKIVSQIKIHKAVGKIVKIDPSKNFFAVVTSRNNINIYNNKNLSLECVLEEHTHIIYDIIFNPNKEKFELYSCSEDSTVRIWNLVLRKCTNYFYQQGASIRHLQMTNDGNFLIGGSLDNKLYIWKILSHQENNYVKPKIYDLNKNEGQINFECMLYYTKISLDYNKKIKPSLLLGDDEGYLTEIDLNNGNIIDNFFSSIHQPIMQVYFYENEKNKENYLYAFTNEQFLIKIKINILLENISNASILGIYPFYCQEILSLKWLNASCNSFAFSSNDNMLKIYDIENDKIKIYEGHSDFIMNITIKNNLIITSSKDNTIRIWNMIYIKENKIDSVKCICILRGHSESVNCSDI
jgi:WD40 repeat protein